MPKFNEALFGKGEKMQSTLSKQQQPLFQQLMQALMGGGAGGAFGGASDVYRDWMNPSGDAMNAFQDVEMRNFNENIIPSLSEQFAGMGSGAMSSSGFRNSATQAGASLQERLAAMRQQLRGQGAQGMQSLGQMGLGNYSMFRPQTGGFMGAVSQGVGEGLGKGATAFMGGM